MTIFSISIIFTLFIIFSVPSFTLVCASLMHFLQCTVLPLLLLHTLAILFLWVFLVCFSYFTCLLILLSPLHITLCPYSAYLYSYSSCVTLKLAPPLCPFGWPYYSELDDSVPVIVVIRPCLYIQFLRSFYLIRFFHAVFILSSIVDYMV